MEEERSYIQIRVIVKGKEKIYTRSNFDPTLTASIYEAFIRSQQASLKSTLDYIDREMV